MPLHGNSVPGTHSTHDKEQDTTAKKESFFSVEWSNNVLSSFSRFPTKMHTFAKILVSTLLVAALVAAAVSNSAGLNDSRKLQQKISDFISFGPGSVPPPPPPPPVLKPKPGRGPVNTLINGAIKASSTGKADKPGSGPVNTLVNGAIKAASTGKADKPGTGSVNTAINGIKTTSATGTKGVRGTNP
jgi:hypothetical protein